MALRSTKLKVAFLAIIVTGLGLYYVVRAGWYPVAMVNGSLISARWLERHVESALQYYSVLLETYGVRDLSSDQRTALVNDVRRASLDKIIEDTLIYQELRKRTDNSLTERVAAALPKQIDPAASALYGLNESRFREMVLKPQAYRELWEAEFASERMNLKEWLAEQKKDASVFIIADGLSWSPTGIKAQ